MIIIIDNGSELIGRVKNILKKRNVKYIVLDHSKEINFRALKNIQGVIMTGGSGTPYGPLNLKSDYLALINLNVPFLGICLGHEIIGVAFNGKIKKMTKKNNKLEKIKIIKKDKIFNNISKEFSIAEYHNYYINKLPKDFIILAKSNNCDIEVMRHKKRKIYGFQGHPEYSGEEGKKIINNFIDMCLIKTK